MFGGDEGRQQPVYRMNHSKLLPKFGSAKNPFAIPPKAESPEAAPVATPEPALPKSEAPKQVTQSLFDPPSSCPAAYRDREAEVSQLRQAETRRRSCQARLTGEDNGDGWRRQGARGGGVGSTATTQGGRTGVEEPGARGGRDVPDGCDPPEVGSRAGALGQDAQSDEVSAGNEAGEEIGEGEARTRGRSTRVVPQTREGGAERPERRRFGNCTRAKRCHSAGDRACGRVEPR